MASTTARATTTTRAPVRLPGRSPSRVRRRRDVEGGLDLSDSLGIAAVVLTGLLAGGMVLIELVLLPFWRGAPPAEFRAWFTAHADRIRALMVPLGAAAGLVTAASATARVLSGHRRSSASVAAAAATAGVIAITVTVNEPANHRFTAGTLSDAQTTELLERWARWHDVRVVLGVFATVAAASALSSRRP
ncbi:anthrone oxygenase family protein [Geodermatophilus sp. SYSU D01186]